MAYMITKRIVSLFLKPFIESYEGIENIPSSGAILAANHASYLDHFLIAARVVKKYNRHVYFLAKKEHFDSFFQRMWHKYLRAIPIDRQAGGKDALEEAIKHLKKGDLIMIYPEGTRSLDGKLAEAKTGVARLALAAEVPVVPIGLTNTHNLMPKGQHYPSLGVKVGVFIGKALYFKDYYGSEDKNVHRLITNKIMKGIAQLCGQKYDYD